MGKKTRFSDVVAAFAQKNGYIWGPEPEIYGGVAGFYSYGPLGKLLKNNIENKIRRLFVMHDIWEVECPTVMPRDVWKASGHLDGFTDPVIHCSSCKSMFRVDKLIEEKYDVVADGMSHEELLAFVQEKDIRCPSCGGRFEPRIDTFNLMMRTTVGSNIEAYNRPETATTTYLPFKRYEQFFRKHYPFGVFQIGKAYRNEISPRQSVLRGREFTQAEGQIFLFERQKHEWPRFNDIENERAVFWPHVVRDEGGEPVEATFGEALEEGWFKNPAYAWLVWLAHHFFVEIGIPRERIRLRQHGPDEKAFYADDAWDVEILTNSFGWVECCGVHDRTDYDLTQHAKMSGEKLEALDPVDGKKKVPHILEIAFGTDRPTFAMIDIFLDTSGERVVYRVPRNMAPLPVAVFPLVNKDGLPEKAREIVEVFRRQAVPVVYDASGSIGRRYARADEKGVPLCITVDRETLENGTVTFRDRDTGRQVRVPVDEVFQKACSFIWGGCGLEDLGEPVE